MDVFQNLQLFFVIVNNSSLYLYSVHRFQLHLKDWSIGEIDCNLSSDDVTTMIGHYNYDFIVRFHFVV